MERRLEDRIRLLCQRLIAAPQNTPEFELAATELRTALKNHFERMRGKLREYPIAKERRADE
jgi:hypothetical protein